LRVVPASDLTGLATVLDDDLLAFLAELLAEGEGDDILAELALAYPVVTASNIDAAVAEFRRVLADRLRSSDAGVSLERTQQ
jgi:tRNA isopentenyl-2-thiomethyl-A-37 hydroxylase MiaE